MLSRRTEKRLGHRPGSEINTEGLTNMNQVQAQTLRAFAKKYAREKLLNKYKYRIKFMLAKTA